MLKNNVKPRMYDRPVWLLTEIKLLQKQREAEDVW